MLGTRSVLLNMNVSSELIFVDDGSTDGSAIELTQGSRRRHFGGDHQIPEKSREVCSAGRGF